MRKRMMALLLSALILLAGCADPAASETTPEETQQEENPMVAELTEKLISQSGDFLPNQVTYQFSGKDVPSLKSENTVLLSLEVKAESHCESLTLTLYQSGSQTEETYYIPTQWSRISLCTDSTLSLAGIKLVTEGRIQLRSFTVENCGKATADNLLPRLGQFLLEDHEKIELPEEGVGAGRTCDLVKSGNMVYSIGDGKFVVTDVSDPTAPKVLGSLSNLGQTRQIALCEGGTDVMVTARGYGAYLIDASNPVAPRIRAVYDSLEMATGISIQGDYAYISNRQYGVEVVDISDLDAPRYVRTVLTGEVQSAQVVDGVLYCGIWGGCRVDMYDMTVPEPVLLGSAPLKGRGDGLFVVKEEGRVLLYAATGHHQVQLPNDEPLTNAAFGQGTGLDIFDVTDPANPLWLSTSRIDGRFYSPSNDFWESFVWEQEGQRIAALVSSYNGVYFFNVDDPKAPVRLTHITVPIPQNSDNYFLHKDSMRTLAYSFNRYSMLQSPIGAVVCEDGVLYLAGGFTDLHVLLHKLVQKPVENSDKTLHYEDADYRTDYPTFDTEGQIHAVTTDGTTFWAACGSDGIAVLDGGLNCSKMLPTEGNCYDVYYKDGVLYAAEGNAGLAAYDPATLEQLWRYAEEGYSVKQVRLSPKSRFAVLHMAHNEGWVLRIEDMTVVFSQSGRAQMYHHYLSNGLVGGRYICFWAQGADEIWLDFGLEDDKSIPTVCTTLRSKTGMVGGVTGYDGKALAVCAGGLLRYDPMTTTDLNGMEVIDVSAYGKPTVSGNRLVTSNRLNGKLFVTDISILTRPSVQREVTLPGNPETALVHAGAIYVPLGNAGLVRIPMP